MLEDQSPMDSENSRMSFLDYVMGILQIIQDRLTVSPAEVERGLIIGGNGISKFVSIITMTVSTIGVLLSTLAVLLLLITAFLFVEWRRIYKNQLLIQFMIARFAYTIFRYFMDVFDGEVEEQSFMQQFGRGFVLVYTEMVLVVWMFVFTRQMYKSLAKVFDTEHTNIWRVSALCWSIPCLYTLIVYMPFLYRDAHMSIYMFISILVKWPILIANGVLLILITKSIVVTNMSRKLSNFRIVGIMIILIIHFCVQQMFIDICKCWIYRYFDKSENDSLPIEVYYALVAFNIYSLYVCAFTIFFWLFGNANTRKSWRSRLRRKKDVSQVESKTISPLSSIEKSPWPQSEPARLPIMEFCSYPRANSVF